MIVAFAVAFAVAVFALAAFPVVERTRREPRQRWSMPSTGFDLNARTVTPTTAYPVTSCGRDVRAGRRLRLNLLRLRNLAYFLNRYCRRSSGIRVRRRGARLSTRASRTVGR